MDKSVVQFIDHLRPREEIQYLQFGGGSRVISANSFWILFAEVDRALDLGTVFAS